MEKSNIMIRLEKREEQQKVENLVRESFWNEYRLGCLEHYVLHQLRNDPHLFQNWILCCFLMKMAKVRKRVSLQNLKAVTEWYKSVY